MVAATPAGKDAAGAVTAATSKNKDADKVRLADAVRCEVYVCFEGPLGAQLKTEVSEKIWKDEFVEIFSLLPLENFNLDCVKPDESKKEEEEKRRYHLILRTFANWLQAFANFASVMGKRPPRTVRPCFVTYRLLVRPTGCMGGWRGSAMMNNSVSIKSFVPPSTGTTRISVCG